MKKEKHFKLDQNQRSNVENFKSYFDNFSIDPTNSARYVDFEITDTKENYRITSVVDYGKFKIEYFYYPSMYFLGNNFIDFRITYDNCDYKFSIYDIFNLFDIKDFSKYYHEDCYTKEEIFIVLDKLTAVVEKYRFDIEKATDSVYFETLVNNFENDWRRSYGSEEDDDEWKEEFNDDFFIDAIHPSFTVTDIKIEKLKKRLEKQNAKNKLDTLYERRLLDYLNSGYNIELSDEKTEYDKKFRKNFLLSIYLLYAICVVIVAVIILVARHIVFKDSIIVYDTYTIFGKELYLPWRLLFGIIVSGLFFSITASDIFAKKMYTLLTKDNSERTKQRFDADMKEKLYGKMSGKALSHLGAIVTLILAVGCMAYTIGDNVALADDYVKYPTLSEGSFCTVAYDDLTVYNVETHWDDDEEDYVKYDSPAFAFSNSKGDYYEAGEIPPDSKAGKLLAQKIEEHNIKVENIKSIEVLDNENSGD